MARWKDVKKGRHKPEKQITSKEKVFYAGFWSRFLALSVDVFMIGIPISLLIYFAFGYETMQSQPGFMDALKGVKPDKEPNTLIPVLTMSIWSLVTLAFWYKTGQTPGKKMAHIVIVDARTHRQAGLLQLIVRLVFFIMPIFAFFSLFVMLFHPRRQTLHDIFSQTVVIYKLK